MSRPLRITGLFLASLTIVTVALAQQSGGTGRSDAPPLAAVVSAADQGKARLSRAADPRRAVTDCPAEACDTPPKATQAALNDATVQGGCGEGANARDRNGKPIRRICQFF
jgi:hypothetical protein